MPSRPSAVGVVVLAAVGVVVALVPARAQQIHRHGFAGRQTALLRGDANVRADEKEHDVSTQSFKSQPSSEHLQVVCEAGPVEGAFVHYYYETPPAPVSVVLSAGVWVKATKNGVQLRARVVFPQDRDPDNPNALLTMLVVGKTYDKARSWDKLTLEDVPALVNKHLVALRAKIGRDVKTDGAYIDRLILNVYTGPGPVDVWVDDLDVGPVQPAPQPDQPAGTVPGVPARNAKSGAARWRPVEMRGGQLLVDGKPYFFRAIRHTGTPLHVLRAAGFDTLWLAPDAAPELVDESTREGWFVIPSFPLVAPPTAVSTAAEVARFDNLAHKYAAADVLFLDLGGGLRDEQKDDVARTADALKSRRGDRRRPLGGDLWDGFSAYSSGTLDVVGAHRWPLFTSLELSQYKEWLTQRRDLAGPNPVFWTWVQNHLPEWYTTSLASRPVEPGAGPPESLLAGPHPEQVRLLTYISLASGCRGLGFWSDAALADSQQGRDRLQGMALLNTELDLLAPVLLSAAATGTQTAWQKTSNPNVQAAIITGQKGLVLLPIWMGKGDQYVPPQGAVQGLKVSVPVLPEGFDPWLITPTGVQCLRATRTSTGTSVTIPEFDLVSPVVFTNDVKLVVAWQNRTQQMGRWNARWALDLARAEYEKVRAVYLRLAGVGAQLPNTARLFEETNRYYTEGEQHFAHELYDKAYQDATRALRPLRVLMRAHWEQAVKTLDVPTASPYAVSFFSLPEHWELAREVQASRPAASVLPHGDFELPDAVPEAGVRVDALPGWSARTGPPDLDRVVVAAGVVQSNKLEDKLLPRTSPPKPKTIFTPSREVTPPDEGYVPPAPELGRGVLKLEVRKQSARGEKPPAVLTPLERTFLAVDSPAVRLPPGTLVRVSGWVKVPEAIAGTADGVLFYDDAGGEPLAVRVMGATGWKQFHLYRRVPAGGQISVTLALTGIGVAYFDDVRIEPLVGGAGAATARRRPAPGATTAGGGARGPVIPAAYRPR